MKEVRYFCVALLMLYVACNNEVVHDEFTSDSIYGFWLQDTTYNQYAVEKSTYIIEFNKDNSMHRIFDYYVNGYYIKIEELPFEFLSESVLTIGLRAVTYAINSNTLAIVSTSSGNYYSRLFYRTKSPKIVPSSNYAAYLRIDLTNKDKELMSTATYKIFTKQNIIYGIESCGFG